MFKALIVDDEQFTLDGLRGCIDWNGFGIEIIGEANNGEEALEFIMDHEVDILFTDVKMPIMDGIRLIQEVRKLGHTMKIIVLSGYEDFEFARSAIQYNVFEYMLKPATLEVIESAVKRLVKLCELEQEKSEKNNHIVKALEEAKPLVEERFFIDLLNGSYDEETTKLYEMQIKAKRYFVAKVGLDNIISENEITQRKQQLMKRIAERLETMQNDIYHVKVIQYDTDCIVVIFMMSQMTNQRELISDLKKVQQSMLRNEEMTISIGVGQVCEEVADISGSYEQAVKALEHKLYFGNNSIMVFEDIVKNTRSRETKLGPWKEQLTKAIGDKNKVLAKEILTEVSEVLKENTEYSIEYIRQMSMEIVLVISLSLTDKYEELENVYNKRKNLLNYLLSLETLNDIFSVLEDLCCTTIDYLDEAIDEGHKDIIRSVLAYMDQNISKDITLEKIADKVYLTPNYIGHIFKEEMGTNYSDYLTNMRMERAKKMLKEPGKKVYEVSLATGYKNANYFGKLFKQYTGMTPKQYKNYAK